MKKAVQIRSYAYQLFVPKSISQLIDNIEMYPHRLARSNIQSTASVIPYSVNNYYIDVIEIHVNSSIIKHLKSNKHIRFTH